MSILHRIPQGVAGVLVEFWTCGLDGRNITLGFRYSFSFRSSCSAFYCEHQKHHFPGPVAQPQTVGPLRPNSHTG